MRCYKFSFLFDRLRQLSPRVGLYMIFVIGALSGCVTMDGYEFHYPAASSPLSDSRFHCKVCAPNVRKVNVHKESNTQFEVIEVYYEVKVKVPYWPYVQWFESDVQGKLTKSGKRAMERDARDARMEEDRGGGGGC